MNILALDLGTVDAIQANGEAIQRRIVDRQLGCDGDGVAVIDLDDATPRQWHYEGHSVRPVNDIGIFILMIRERETTSES